MRVSFCIMQIVKYQNKLHKILKFKFIIKIKLKNFNLI
jgi:hypothetical protein